MGANNAKDIQLSTNDSILKNSSSEKLSFNDILYVLYDFKASFDNQLTLTKGEYVKLIKVNQDKNWCEVMKVDSSKSSGWVPTNYLSTIQSINASNNSSLYQAQSELINCPWYHGKITRQDGENLLRSGINGSFLIRQSESQPGQLSVTLRYEGRVYHYRITYNGVSRKFYITENNQFNKISELVDYHSKYPEGLISPLLYPVINKSCPHSIGGPGVANQKLPTHSRYFPGDSKSPNLSGGIASGGGSCMASSENWEIDRSEILMHQKLGGGQYGDVYEAVWKRYNVIVAVKTLKDDFHLKLDDFLKEAVIMKRLKHKNLVQLYGVCSNEPPYYLVTEFISKGSLLEYLKNCNRMEVTPYVLVYMATQISAGMAFLESNNFIHRDLAARNCLVGEYYLVKIGDFGLARYIKNNESYTAKIGAKFPIKWTAPESLAYNRFSSKSDVWSFGVVLWELATYGLSPYPGVDLQDVYHLLEKGYRLDRPEGCPQIVYALMLKCWEWEPNQRPNFSQLVSCLEVLYFGNRDNSELYTSNVFANNLFTQSKDVITSPPTMLSKSKLNSNSEPFLAKSSPFPDKPNHSNVKWTTDYSSRGVHTMRCEMDGSLPDESGVGDSILSSESTNGSFVRPLITYKTSHSTSASFDTTTASSCATRIGVEKKIKFKDDLLRVKEDLNPLSIKNASNDQFSTIPAKDRIDNYFKSLKKINESELIQHGRQKANSNSNSSYIIEEDDITSVESNTEYLPESHRPNSNNHDKISSIESDDNNSIDKGNPKISNNGNHKLTHIASQLIQTINSAIGGYYSNELLRLLVAKLVKYRNELNLCLTNCDNSNNHGDSDEVNSISSKIPQDLLNYFNIIFTNITTNFNESKMINVKCFEDLKQTVMRIQDLIR